MSKLIALLSVLCCGCIKAAGDEAIAMFKQHVERIEQKADEISNAVIDLSDKAGRDINSTTMVLGMAALLLGIPMVSKLLNVVLGRMGWYRRSMGLPKNGLDNGAPPL